MKKIKINDLKPLILNSIVYLEFDKERIVYKMSKLDYYKGKYLITPFYKDIIRII